MSPGNTIRRNSKRLRAPKPALAGRPSLTDASRPGAVRLQKLLAQAGVASRRTCEALIESGKVIVNGVVVTSLPAWAAPGDRITIDGVPVRFSAQAPRPANAPAPSRTERHNEIDAPSRRLVYILLHKPRGVITAASDPEGRRTVLDLVDAPGGARLFPVGRLDFDSQGLLLLTNDGDLANRLTHPRYGIPKTYRALVRGGLDDDAVERLERDVFAAERKASKSAGAPRAARVGIRIVSRDAGRTTLEITLQEGRNRQVRRILADAGFPVKRLVQVKMGPLTLRGLASGRSRNLTRDEVQALRLAAQQSPGETPAPRPARERRSPGAPRAARAPRASRAPRDRR